MRIPGILKTGLLGVSGFIFLAGMAALGYEQGSRWYAERQFSADGEFVDVGGHRLHMVRLGNGSPTVVFESGMDPVGHLSWYKVQEDLARFTTTVSYDRAGILWSDSGVSPKTGASIESDLSNLLVRGNFPKPYIVVGHSSAGIILRRFISNHRQDIAGVVLVDASHPDQMSIRPPKIPSRLSMELMSRFGLIRFTSSRRLPNTNPEDYINQAGTALIHRSIGGMFDDAASLGEAANEASAITSFGDLPLRVLSATGYRERLDLSDSSAVEMAKIRTDLQQDLLTLSTRSKQILANQSTHYIQLEQPELVTGAIFELIETSRE